MPNEPNASTGRPAGRYGAHADKPAPRWRRWALLAVGVVAVCVATFIGYQNLGSAPIEAERIGFTELPNNAMEIEFSVTRENPDKPVVCVVRTREVDGPESGRREVLVPPADDGYIARAVIKSGERPVTADVFGCSYTIPEYLAIP